MIDERPNICAKFAAQSGDEIRQKAKIAHKKARRHLNENYKNHQVVKT